VGKRFKFSPLKARALIIMLPTIGLAGIIFSQSVLIYIFRFEYFELILFNFDLPFDQLISMLFYRFLLFYTPSLIIYRLVKDNLLLNSNIQELRDCYSELEDSWDYLNDADYLDKGLQVLVYGDHLICYRTFDIVYLPECSKIIASMTTSVSVRNPRRAKLIHFFASYLDGSESELRTNELRSFAGINQKARKDALFDYIRENFDYIELETYD
jgi:hypothetical protein